MSASMTPLYVTITFSSLPIFLSPNSPKGINPRIIFDVPAAVYSLLPSIKAAKVAKYPP